MSFDKRHVRRVLNDTCGYEYEKVHNLTFLQYYTFYFITRLFSMDKVLKLLTFNFLHSLFIIFFNYYLFVILNVIFWKYFRLFRHKILIVKIIRDKSGA